MKLKLNFYSFAYSNKKINEKRGILPSVEFKAVVEKTLNKIWNDNIYKMFLQS